MAYSVTVSASIAVVDTGVTPNNQVAGGSVSDQQSSLAEYDSLSFVLPAGVIFGSPVTLNLGVFKPKSVWIQCDNPIKMKIGSGSDIHLIRTSFLATFSASEPTQLVFATGAGVSGDTNVKVILGSSAS